MAANKQHSMIRIEPSSSPPSSWAPLAPSAASIGWDNADSNLSSQAGYKRQRVLPSNVQQETQVSPIKENRRNVNKNKSKTKKNVMAIKKEKKTDVECTESYICTWVNQTDAVVTVTQECIFCLIGMAQISLEEGNADILGFRLDNSRNRTQTVRVESPSWNSLITIQADANVKMSIRSVRTSPDDVAKTFSICTPSSAKSVRPTVLPPSWVKAVDDVMQDLINRKQQQQDSKIESTSLVGDQPKSSVVVCGAKGVGKSTCLRYLTNRMLSTQGGWDRVAILDADVGQPELSPPGMITLTILHMPLLSPPHLHMVMGNHSEEEEEKPVQFSYFFGSISPKNDPQRYLHCIQLLQDKYRQIVTEQYDGNWLQLPLLVNTDGWVKGLGFQILSTLLADTLQPSHVIQIQGELKSKMFDLDETVVPSYRTLHMAVPYNCYDMRSLLPVNTAEPTSRLGASSIPSLAWRSLRFCTYFLGDSNFWNEPSIKFVNVGIVDEDHVIARRLAAMAPYMVPMEAVHCHLIGDGADDIGMSEEALWQVLNGSIVGLCTTNDTVAGVETNDFLMSPCVGLGLIRAVDPVRRLFYVLSPVDEVMLRSVVAFVGGNLQLPIECLFRGKFSESFPFLSCEGLAMGVIGADPMKSRNNISRRGFSNAAP